MANAFTVEIWTLYALGTVILLLRFFARWKVVGFRQMQGDDAMAVLCLVRLEALILLLKYFCDTSIWHIANRSPSYFSL